MRILTGDDAARPAARVPARTDYGYDHEADQVMMDFDAKRPRSTHLSGAWRSRIQSAGWCNRGPPAPRPSTRRWRLIGRWLPPIRLWQGGHDEWRVGAIVRVWTIGMLVVSAMVGQPSRSAG